MIQPEGCKLPASVFNEIKSTSIFDVCRDCSFSNECECGRDADGIECPVCGGHGERFNVIYSQPVICECCGGRGWIPKSIATVQLSEIIKFMLGTKPMK